MGDSREAPLGRNLHPQAEATLSAGRLGHVGRLCVQEERGQSVLAVIALTSCSNWITREGEWLEGPARAWQASVLIILPVTSELALPSRSEATKGSSALTGLPGGSPHEEYVQYMSPATSFKLLNLIIPWWEGLNILFVLKIIIIKPDKFLK